MYRTEQQEENGTGSSKSFKKSTGGRSAGQRKQTVGQVGRKKKSKTFYNIVVNSRRHQKYLVAVNLPYICLRSDVRLTLQNNLILVKRRY